MNQGSLGTTSLNNPDTLQSMATGTNGSLRVVLYISEWVVENKTKNKEYVTETMPETIQPTKHEIFTIWFFVHILHLYHHYPLIQVVDLCCPNTVAI